MKAAMPDDQEVASPCISVCEMMPEAGVCAGCFRTLDEIAAWGRMSDEDKRQVWALIAQRLPQEKP